MSRPDFGEAEVEAVSNVLRSGWITSGPVTAKFEEDFARYCGAPHAVSVSSGTAGLHILLMAMGIGGGDEVITPSMTFASTVNQVALAGAKPVFVDCEYGTLNLKAGDIESLITPGTKAVIPVHFAGAPCDLDPLMEAASKHGLAVIEDAAHAVGTAYKGKPVGSHGNPAVFSFHPIKNMTTGEGGMVTLHDGELAKKIRLLRFHGIDRDAWKRYGKGGVPGYDIGEPGFKYNMTDIQSALGSVQLSRVGVMNARRKALAKRYLAGLEGVPGLDLPGSPVYEHAHSWHLFIVKVRGMAREKFFAGMAEMNVGCGLHFPPCHLLSFVRDRFGTGPGTLPETEKAGECVVSLPLFPGMSDADADYTVSAVREVVASH